MALGKRGFKFRFLSFFLDLGLLPTCLPACVPPLSYLLSDPLELQLQIVVSLHVVELNLGILEEQPVLLAAGVASQSQHKALRRGVLSLPSSGQPVYMISYIGLTKECPTGRKHYDYNTVMRGCCNPKDALSSYIFLFLRAPCRLFRLVLRLPVSHHTPLTPTLVQHLFSMENYSVLPLPGSFSFCYSHTTHHIAWELGLSMYAPPVEQSGW